MSTACPQELQACCPLANHAGYWTLKPGRALTLQPQAWGRLCIAQGRVWLTVDDPWRERVGLWGDHVVSAGESVVLPPGATAVVEGWERAGGVPVHFNWVPQPSPAHTRWQREVRRPLQDLTRSLGTAAVSLGRLLGGLAAYGEFLVAGRGRVLSRFESNPP